MAEPKTAKPAPAPPPKPAVAPPPADMAKAAQANVAQTKTSRDLLRPFRYTALFINGTLNDTAEYALSYGRKGTRWGIAMGILAAIATTTIVPLVLCAGVGFAGGIALGMAKGLGSGGIEAMSRQRRIDRYGDDLEDRAQIQQAAKTKARQSYSTPAERRAKENALNVPQIFARDKEFEQDYQTYWTSHHEPKQTHQSWQDRVSASVNYDQGLGY